jgi:hypothetical protein
MFREDGTVALGDSAARVEWILDLWCSKELLYDPWYQKVREIDSGNERWKD